MPFILRVPVPVSVIPKPVPLIGPERIVVAVLLFAMVGEEPARVIAPESSRLFAPAKVRCGAAVPFGLMVTALARALTPLKSVEAWRMTAEGLAVAGWTVTGPVPSAF